MGKFRIDSIGELARQLAFAPLAARSAQVAAAEELLHAIDPTKAYPPEFIVFKITGFRQKTANEQLLTGIALRHDLGLLIEQVSETLDIHSTTLAEPVLTIDDVTERFNVTSKTIQRWRRKGLPARRFIFADGKRRVGFLVSSVERFFAGHREQVDAGTNFSQIGETERAEILRRARRLAVRCGCCGQSISRRIARKLNRSPATVLHTIRKHDQDHPADAIFAQAAQPLGDETRGRLLKGHRRGLAISTLAKRSCQTREAVYRVVLEERIAALNTRKIKFIDDPLYHGEEAIEAIASILSQQDVMAADQRGEGSRVPRDLPPYLQALYRTPLLSAARERSLFLAFNYYKYRFVTARRRLEPELARARDLARLEALLARATDLKNQIVQANLRLVVSVARKHLRPSLSLMELVSDGNIILMRAVESFDTHKGYRFSTYATFALMKGFARSVAEMRSDQSGAGVDVRTLAGLTDSRENSRRDQMFDRAQVTELLSQLDDREREVVSAHYGLNYEPDGPATYEQVGEQLGLTKQRVRQIEQFAIAKLRGRVAAEPA